MAGSESIALLDNGSLRPESVLSLRRIASQLSERLGRAVTPVSMLHSSRIPAEQLGGEQAMTWRNYLRQQVESGVRRVTVLPLFFGPSAAIVDYLPKVSREVFARMGATGATLEVGEPLVRLDDPRDDALARILAEFIIKKMDTEPGSEPRPTVILVDHGSPVKKVARCRDLVARQLESILGDRVSKVVPSSMERRADEKYAFNEPLLERALEQLVPTDAVSGAILCLMFISPGRHAGPGGDIAEIVARSTWVKLGRRIRSTPLVGESPLLIELLARRFRELEARLSMDAKRAEDR